MCYCAPSQPRRLQWLTPSVEFPPFFTSLLRFIWSEAGASQARQLRLGTLSGSFCCICKWSCTKVDKYGLIAAQSLQYFEAWNICSTKLDPYVHNEIEIKKIHTGSQTSYKYVAIAAPTRLNRATHALCLLFPRYLSREGKQNESSLS